MSSHHFVKEGQEPALLIVEPLSLELIGPLLEWAPLVLVLDSALEEVLRWGIKIDVVLGGIDQMNKLKDRLQEQAPVKVISYLPTDDPLAIAFYFLISSRHGAVNILVGQDETIFTRIQPFISQMDIGLLDNRLHWSAIRSGVFEKWLPANATLQIRSSSQNLQITGLEQQDNNLKVVKDGIIRIQSEGMFWVGEPV